MSDDTLDRLTPIGQEPEPADLDALPDAHPSGHSRIGVKQLAKQARQRSAYNPHAAVNAGFKNLTSKGTYNLAPALPIEEQRRMASDLMRQFYQEAKGYAETGERLNTQGRKNAAIAFGVVTDKTVMLRGQPETPPGSPAEAESVRPKVLELVRRLAALDTDTPVESQ